MADIEDESNINPNNKLLIEAITAQMDHMMNRKFEALRQEFQHDRLGMEGSLHEQEQGRAARRNREPHGSIRDEAASEYYRSGDSYQSHPRGSRRGREARFPPQDHFGGFKPKVPPFHGKNDPDAYLEWEKKMDLVFDCQPIQEIHKVKMATTEFYDYALSWWDQLVTSRRRNGEYPVTTWQEMKLIMRKRFVPGHHHRELHRRLRTLTQGSRSVEEFYQELETLLLRADVIEDREATMSRFLGGLNREIQDRLEMQHYVEIEEMLHKAIMIEQQLKRRPVPRPSYGTGIGSSRPVYQKDPKLATPKEEAKPTIMDKGKAIANPSRTRDIKCFKCQGQGHYANECSNKRVMVLLENGEVESEDEKGR